MGHVSAALLLHHANALTRTIRYTLCTAMQRHFTDAVVTVLGLQNAAKDATHARLERCIIDVRHVGSCLCSCWRE